MTSRQQVIDFCLTLMSTYEDYPFDDSNWTVIRHKGNKKIFAWILERKGNIWINVKGKPEWNDFWRRTFNSVIPAYHLNKTHWNSIILDGTVPDDNIYDMITESYELTKPKNTGRKK